MKITLIREGLLEPRRLDAWLPEKRQAIRRAVETSMKVVGRNMVDAARSRMRAVFKVHRTGFLKSMRHKVYAGTPQKLPALLVGSKINWLGIHTRGGTVRSSHRSSHRSSIGGGNSRMLIPLLPEHQRIGRKAFARVVDGLMRSGNAFFIKKGGKAILMAENIKGNATELRRFKRAERTRTGARSIKRGQEIPIAVLVPTVSLRGRFDLAAVVRAHMPKLAETIVQQLPHQ